jgi:hypothetical protein
MRTRIVAVILLAGGVLAACQGSSTQKCSFDQRTELAQPSTTPISSSWPKFRADPANTGRAAVDLGTAKPQSAELLFDGYCSVADTQTTLVCRVGERDCPSNQPCVRIGTTETTPIISQNVDTATELVFVGSSDGTVYFTSVAGTAPTFVDPIQVQGTIVGSPLLGRDGTLYVSSTNALSRFITNGTEDTNGTVQNGAGLTGFVAASPNIWDNDGTVFVGSQTGNFPAVCSNGVPRFVVTVPANPTTTIVVQDPAKPPTDITAIVVVGGINGQVRAYNLSGNQVWSFFASATINAAPVADVANPEADPRDPQVFYVADSAGHVFAANLATGQPVRAAFDPPQDIGPITASPALGRDAAGTTIPKLYVAGENGILYALNRTPGNEYGHVCWFFDTGGRINSSPAVATGAMHQDVIIVAADDTEVLTPGSEPVAVGGKVFAVTDDNDCNGGERTADWTVIPGANEGHPRGYTIGASSPAIAANTDGSPGGTIYIGRTGGRLDTTGGLVNEGGALYAIEL